MRDNKIIDGCFSQRLLSPLIHWTQRTGQTVTLTLISVKVEEKVFIGERTRERSKNKTVGTILVKEHKNSDQVVTFQSSR